MAAIVVACQSVVPPSSVPTPLCAFSSPTTLPPSFHLLTHTLGSSISVRSVWDIEFPSQKLRTDLKSTIFYRVYCWFLVLTHRANKYLATGYMLVEQLHYVYDLIVQGQL